MEMGVQYSPNMRTHVEVDNIVGYKFRDLRVGAALEGKNLRVCPARAHDFSRDTDDGKKVFQFENENESFSGIFRKERVKRSIRPCQKKKRELFFSFSVSSNNTWAKDHILLVCMFKSFLMAKRNTLEIHYTC